MTQPALILQFGATGPPGLLGDWLAAREIPLVVYRADQDGAEPNPREHAFVAVLGSRWNPNDTHEPQVVNAQRLVRRAVDHDVPVLGLCFGGQLLASVLGGTVERGARPELGWHEIESAEPELVPAGPWLQWHWDRFTTPSGADEVARNEIGPQAFRHGRHLGVQFHPESTIEIVAAWARHDRERLGFDGVALLEEGRAHADAAARNAYRLFDGFWDEARSNGRKSDDAA